MFYCEAKYPGDKKKKKNQSLTGMALLRSRVFVFFVRQGSISLRYAISLICSFLSGATSKLLVYLLLIACSVSV